MANYNRVVGFGSFPSRGNIIDRIPYSAAFDGASGYMNRDFGSAGNRRTMTWSFWIRTNSLGLGSEAAIQVSGDDQSGYPSNRVAMHAGKWVCYSAEDAPQNNKIEISSDTRLFRDHTSWYHLVFALDTTQATAADRIKVWVNGVNETNRWTQTTATQNLETYHNDATEDDIIGKYHTGSYFDGNLAHYHFIDGTAYDASYFGEYDNKTGEWIPIAEPNVTYGSNGYFLDFADSSNMGNDVSGNNNDYTVNGTIKQSVNRPGNNFATYHLNHHKVGGQANIRNNGLEVINNNDSYTHEITCATLAMNRGKWYWETKYSNTGGYLYVGFARNGGLDTTKNIRENKGLGDGDDANSWAFAAGNSSGQIIKKLRHNNADAVADMGVTPAVNDIIQCWLDLDNGKAWWGINGTVMDSGSGTGVPNTGTNPHFTFTVGDEFYIPAISTFGFNGPPEAQANFGEGTFGMTAVSSAVSDNNGHGSFEYSPLDGFYSICTRNIREFG